MIDVLPWALVALFCTQMLLFQLWEVSIARLRHRRKHPIWEQRELVVMKQPLLALQLHIA